METLRHHFVHHRKHMIGCVAGALVALLGGLLHQPIVAIAGAVVCGGSCIDMARMTVVKPKRG